MDGKVTWHQDLTFTGRAATGFTVPLGADTAVGGANDGFRPLELMGVSLAGCTAMDVISILHKKQQQVTAFDVEVHASQAEEHPKVFTHATVTYLITGRGVDEAAVQRAIELSATKYCPAQGMLSKAFPMELLYEIYEDEGEGKARLVKRATYQPQNTG
jgi:putative redox protein